MMYKALLSAVVVCGVASGGYLLSAPVTHATFEGEEVRCPRPTPTPTPTPTATPTPTPAPTATPDVTPEPTRAPDPSAGQHSQTVLTDPICVGGNFDARMQVLRDGKAESNVTIKFVYEKEAKYAKTGADGWAGVAYGYRSESDVEFFPEQGFPQQLQKVKLSANCAAPAVLGVQSPAVLGATTMAKTGVLEETIFTMIGLTGAGSTTVGSLLYVKKKTHTRTAAQE